MKRRSSLTHNPKYLAWIRQLPCWACYREVYEYFGDHMPDIADVWDSTNGHGRQQSLTEAAHVGLSTTHRGLSQKAPDDESIPLCGFEHHREGPESIHKLGSERFFEAHSANRDTVIRLFQRIRAAA